MIDVQVEISAAGALEPVTPPADAKRWVEIARTAAQATLADRGVSEAEVSVTLLDDAGIRSLNRDHLDHDRTTDVLAFALYGEGEPVLGDVYVGWQQASRQAGREDVPLIEEIARLVVHGTLHVLGHDHPEAAADRPRSKMYRLQESIVARLDLDAPHPAPAGSVQGAGGAA